jgi:hypothetical protein
MSAVQVPCRPSIRFPSNGRRCANDNPAAGIARTKRLLREIAFVLHATRQVRAAIESSGNLPTKAR